ncbi:ABC transporter ATP-binding protein [Longispora urticae]
MLDQADRLLLRLARRAPGWTAVLAAATLTSTVTALVAPSLLAEAVDEALHSSDDATAVSWFAAATVVAVLAAILSAVAEGGCISVGTAWLRHTVLRHLLGMGVEGQRTIDAGDATSRLIASTGDAAGIVPTMLRAVMSLITSVGGVVALGLIDWRLAVTFVLAVPPSALLVKRLVKGASTVFTDYRNAQSVIVARLTDAFAGARTIHATGRRDQEVERILRPLPELSSKGYAIWAVQRRVIWQSLLLMSVIEVIVLAVAGFRVAEGTVSAGDFLAAAGYTVMGLGLLGQVEAFMALSYARAGTRRITEVLAEQPTVRARSRSVLPDGPGTLTLTGVVYHGADGTAILNDLELEVPGGQTVAVVGESGSGKSTLAAVAGGLLSPHAGTVLLDGSPLADLDPRAAVAYAFERPHLLGATIGATIGYANPTATTAEIQRAAAAAHADPFILRLPKGYDTSLFDAPMSGGEIQRLGLARALAQGARVVILDDATSSLDTVTEAEVRQAMTTHLAGRTRVVVAHRAATAGQADLVAWLHEGRIRALAPHRDLWLDADYRATFGTETAS